MNANSFNYSVSNLPPTLPPPPQPPTAATSLANPITTSPSNQTTIHTTSSSPSSWAHHNINLSSATTANSKSTHQQQQQQQIRHLLHHHHHHQSHIHQMPHYTEQPLSAANSNNLTLPPAAAAVLPPPPLLPPPTSSPSYHHHPTTSPSSTPNISAANNYLFSNAATAGTTFTSNKTNINHPQSANLSSTLYQQHPRATHISSSTSQAAYLPTPQPSSLSPLAAHSHKSAASNIAGLPAVAHTVISSPASSQSSSSLSAASLMTIHQQPPSYAHPSIGHLPYQTSRPQGSSSNFSTATLSSNNLQSNQSDNRQHSPSKPPGQYSPQSLANGINNFNQTIWSPNNMNHQLTGSSAANQQQQQQHHHHHVMMTTGRRTPLVATTTSSIPTQLNIPTSSFHDNSSSNNNNCSQNKYNVSSSHHAPNNHSVDVNTFNHQQQSHQHNPLSLQPSSQSHSLSSTRSNNNIVAPQPPQSPLNTLGITSANQPAKIVNVDSLPYDIKDAFYQSWSNATFAQKFPDYVRQIILDEIRLEPTEFSFPQYTLRRDILQEEYEAIKKCTTQAIEAKLKMNLAHNLLAKVAGTQNHQAYLQSLTSNHPRVGGSTSNAKQQGSPNAPREQQHHPAGNNLDAGNNHHQERRSPATHNLSNQRAGNPPKGGVSMDLHYASQNYQKRSSPMPQPHSSLNSSPYCLSDSQARSQSSSVMQSGINHQFNQTLLHQQQLQHSHRQHASPLSSHPKDKQSPFQMSISGSTDSCSSATNPASQTGPAFQQPPAAHQSSRTPSLAAQQTIGKNMIGYYNQSVSKSASTHSLPTSHPTTPALMDIPALNNLNKMSPSPIAHMSPRDLELSRAMQLHQHQHNYGDALRSLDQTKSLASLNTTTTDASGHHVQPHQGQTPSDMSTYDYILSQQKKALEEQSKLQNTNLSNQNKAHAPNTFTSTNTSTSLSRSGAPPSSTINYDASQSGAPPRPQLTQNHALTPTSTYSWTTGSNDGASPSDTYSRVNLMPTPRHHPHQSSPFDPSSLEAYRASLQQQAAMVADMSLNLSKQPTYNYNNAHPQGPPNSISSFSNNFNPNAGVNLKMSNSQQQMIPMPNSILMSTINPDNHSSRYSGKSLNSIPSDNNNFATKSIVRGVSARKSSKKQPLKHHSSKKDIPLCTKVDMITVDQDNQHLTKTGDSYMTPNTSAIPIVAHTNTLVQENKLIPPLNATAGNLGNTISSIVAHDKYNVETADQKQSALFDRLSKEASLKTYPPTLHAVDHLKDLNKSKNDPSFKSGLKDQHLIPSTIKAIKSEADESIIDEMLQQHQSESGPTISYITSKIEKNEMTQGIEKKTHEFGTTPVGNSPSTIAGMSTTSIGSTSVAPLDNANTNLLPENGQDGDSSRGDDQRLSTFKSSDIDSTDKHLQENNNDLNKCHPENLKSNDEKSTAVFDDQTTVNKTSFNHQTKTENSIAQNSISNSNGANSYSSAACKKKQWIKLYHQEDDSTPTAMINNDKDDSVNTKVTESISESVQLSSGQDSESPGINSLTTSKNTTLIKNETSKSTRASGKSDSKAALGRGAKNETSKSSNETTSQNKRVQSGNNLSKLDNNSTTSSAESEAEDKPPEKKARRMPTRNRITKNTSNINDKNAKDATASSTSSGGTANLSVLPVKSKASRSRKRDRLAEIKLRLKQATLGNVHPHVGSSRSIRKPMIGNQKRQTRQQVTRDVPKDTGDSVADHSTDIDDEDTSSTTTTGSKSTVKSNASKEHSHDNRKQHDIENNSKSTTKTGSRGTSSNASPSHSNSNKKKKLKLTEKTSNTNNCSASKTSPRVSTGTLNGQNPQNNESEMRRTMAIHKRSGETFLQKQSCVEVDPDIKVPRCLECRQTRQTYTSKNDKTVSSKQRTNWGDFCRFYEFRKLKYKTPTQLVTAGFSEPIDADEADELIWSLKTDEFPTNINEKIAKFIIDHLGDQFCDLVMQERDAKTLYYKHRDGNSKPIIWKRAVHGVREMCDVCATTLFNRHFGCEKCGFVVCIDCYKTKALHPSSSDNTSNVAIAEVNSPNTITLALNTSVIKEQPDKDLKPTLDDTSDSLISIENASCNNNADVTAAIIPTPTVTQSKNRRDVFNWISCAKNKLHSHKNLVLIQIIAGDSLDQIWTALHNLRATWSSKSSCKCDQGSENQEPELQTRPLISLPPAIKQEIPTSQADSIKPLDNNISIQDSVKPTIPPLTTHHELNDISNKTINVNDGSTLGEEDTTNHSTLRGLLLEQSMPSTLTLATISNQQTNTIEPVVASSDGSGADEDKAIMVATKDIKIEPENFDPICNDKDQIKLEKIDSPIAEDSKERPTHVDDRKDATIKLTSTKLDSSSHDSENVSAGQQETLETAGSHIFCDNDLLVLMHPRHKDNVKLFRVQWKLGKPILVRGMDKSINMNLWLPQYFSEKFGFYRNDLIDCRNDNIHKHSMKKYWDGFEQNYGQKKTIRKHVSTMASAINSDDNSTSNSSIPNNVSNNTAASCPLWKMKDWPPSEDFGEILPDHYKDYMDNLPLSIYTTRNGQLNLACRIPNEMLRPDLGPKLYSAYGTTKFSDKGTTNLHLDMSDAINVMMYVGGAKAHADGLEEQDAIYKEIIDYCDIDSNMKEVIRDNKGCPGALWHIFKPSDAAKLRIFLNKVAEERNISANLRADPIHDQFWYLDQTLRKRLFDEYGVKPFSILQCMGDAIIIPAGAPHQVKNVNSCIKVATDFVSPENVDQCFQLTREFRNLPETHMNHEDKLQIKNIVYHAIKDALRYLQKLDQGEVPSSDTDEDDCSAQVDDNTSTAILMGKTTNLTSPSLVEKEEKRIRKKLVLNSSKIKEGTVKLA